VGPEGQPPPPLLTANAHYDFQQWVADNGEQGFNNDYPFTDTMNGLTLTATAFESPYSTPSHVYMDGLSGGIIGGMGVCSNLDGAVQCTPSSDDSVSIDGDNAETLHWDFSHNITQVTLELGAEDHSVYNSREFEYKYGSQDWLTAMTDANGFVTLNFDGSSNQLMFKAVSGALNHQFYFRNADVTYTQ
jgi:hypothetical protein